MSDRRFREQWTVVKATFDVASHQDDKGIIRRRMVAERGFRPSWQLDWHESAARFQAVFDAFCQRWDLYGMACDRPLLMKLTVNLTPHGTMIFIPSWWSLDRGRVTSKQGPKLTRNQKEQAAEAEMAARLDADARAEGLKGTKRVNRVMEKLGWKIGNARQREAAEHRLRRVLSRAKRLSVE